MPRITQATEPKSRYRLDDPVVRDTFLSVLAEAGDVKAACAAAGIGRQTAYAHRKEDRAFATEWDEAVRKGRVDRVDRVEDSLYLRATRKCVLREWTFTEEPVRDKGGYPVYDENGAMKTVQRRKLVKAREVPPDVTAMKEILHAERPEKYGDADKVRDAKFRRIEVYNGMVEDLMVKAERQARALGNPAYAMTRAKAIEALKFKYPDIEDVLQGRVTLTPEDAAQ